MNRNFWGFALATVAVVGGIVAISRYAPHANSAPAAISISAPAQVDALALAPDASAVDAAGDATPGE